MTEIDPTTLTPDVLAGMLTAWAEGYYPDEAAVGLLVHGAGGVWLRRRDFLAACVEAVDDGWTGDSAVPMVIVDWDMMDAFSRRARASSGELGVLRVAASLAGADTGTLREVTESLDVTSLGLVLDAIAHRAGWHEHGHYRTVTGQWGGAR